jgi:hypothetical protein
MIDQSQTTIFEKYGNSFVDGFIQRVNDILKHGHGNIRLTQDFHATPENQQFQNICQYRRALIQAFWHQYGDLQKIKRKQN